jgi:hypothetical protein
VSSDPAAEAAAEAAALEAAVPAAGTPGRAVSERAYLKTDLEFAGAPPVEALLRDARPGSPGPRA